MNEPTATDRPRRVGYRLAGVAIVLVALAVLFWFAGIDDVLVSVAALRRPDVAAVVAAGLLPLVLWGVELRLVLGGIDVGVGPARGVALFVASVFLNNVTPFGQVGGDPPSGLVIADACGIPFERGLVAIAGVNAINRVGVLALGVVGVASFGPGLGGGWSPAGAIAVWTALLGVLLAAWVYREAVVEAVGPPLAAAIARVGRGVPFVPPPTESAVHARLRGFVAAVERLAAEPQRLLAALLLGFAGHLAVAVTLWLTLDAVGVPASLPVVLVVIPLAKLSGLSPTPGGAGSAVVVLAGLLVALAGVPTAEATVAALVYRTAAFWVPTAIGGVVTVVLVGGIVPE